MPCVFVFCDGVCVRACLHHVSAVRGDDTALYCRVAVRALLSLLLRCGKVCSIATAETCMLVLIFVFPLCVLFGEYCYITLSQWQILQLYVACIELAGYYSSCIPLGL